MKEMNRRIDDIRDDMNAEIERLQQQTDEIPSKKSTKAEMDERHLNFCIRNHPQSERENVSCIVSDLLTDGLHLYDSGFKQAVRTGRDDRKPGVIIVHCESIENKTETTRRSSSGKAEFTTGFISTQINHRRHVLVTTWKHCHRLMIERLSAGNWNGHWWWQSFN